MKHGNPLVLKLLNLEITTLSLAHPFDNKEKRTVVQPTTMDHDLIYSTPRIIKGSSETSLLDTAFYATTDSVFQRVEEPALFPNGGNDAMFRFISEQLQYPNVESCIQGRILVLAVVERNGELTHLKVLRGLAPDFEKEALRVVRLMPRWVPARIYGQSVRSTITIPILFRIL